MKLLLKNSLLVIISFFILILIYEYLLTYEQKRLLLSVDFITHLISGFFLIASFFVSGIEIAYIYKKTSNLNLKSYDVLTLPYVINLWGYIIPFQGSFLYLLSYFKIKYKMDIKSSTYIYFYIFLTDLIFFSIIGAISTFFFKNLNIQFFLIFAIISFLPIFLKIGGYFLNKIQHKNAIINKILFDIQYIVNNINQLYKNIKLIAALLIFNILITMINIFWSYWASTIFNYEIPFYVFFYVSILLKLTMLFKLTPGNLGIIQLVNGGAFALFGFDPKIGILISVFQFVTFFIFSFPIGIIASLNNLRYIKFRDLKINRKLK